MLVPCFNSKVFSLTSGIAVQSCSVLRPRPFLVAGKATEVKLALCGFSSEDGHGFVPFRTVCFTKRYV